MVSYDLKVVQRFGHEIEGGAQWPRPHCPVCREGCVSWDKPTATENNQSKELWDFPDWEPDWISGRMYVTGHCENGACEQLMAAVGTYRVGVSTAIETLNSQHHGEFYSEYYKLEYFSPPLVLLTLPEVVPGNVRAAVERASPILFADPSFAATALRGSVERFMSSQGIRAFNHKGTWQPLHTRIDTWEAETKSHRAAELLRAVKWIGNEGTHDGEPLTVNDVIDGLEFIEAAFHELFVAPEITERMQAVNQAKGRYQAKGPAPA
ncbi:DUF4145 domain-containing protein [Paenarthrobacter sp. TYUT067]|nr:DUF4145 domain-containing protein [Paenarthrobacter sp. TYUT067]